MHVNSVAFGRCVRRLRKELAMTQAVLAERCDVSIQFIGQMERGEKLPGLDTFISLCIHLRAAPGVFLSESMSADELFFMNLLPSYPPSAYELRDAAYPLQNTLTAMFFSGMFGKENIPFFPAVPNEQELAFGEFCGKTPRKSRKRKKKNRE